MLSGVIYVYNSIQCLHYTKLSLLVKALTDIFRYEAYICQASGFTGMKDNNRQLISFFLLTFQQLEGIQSLQEPEIEWQSVS